MMLMHSFFDTRNMRLAARSLSDARAYCLLPSLNGVICSRASGDAALLRRLLQFFQNPLSVLLFGASCFLSCQIVGDYLLQ